MYAWHLKKVQIKHMPILYSAFLIIVFVLWNYLKQIPDTASEEQLKSAFLLAQVSDIGFNCIFWARGEGNYGKLPEAYFLVGCFFFCILFACSFASCHPFLYNKRAMCKWMVCDDSSVGFHAHADFYIVLYKTFHIGGCSSWSCTYCG